MTDEIPVSKVTIERTESDGTLKVMDLGIPTDITETWTISSQMIAIPTKPSEETYVMDSGVRLQFLLNISRCNPKVAERDDDSTTWSNARWVTELRKWANRWQAETDGCVFRYIPAHPELYRPITVNAYICSYNDNYSSGCLESINAEITLKVGGMKCNYFGGLT